MTNVLVSIQRISVPVAIVAASAYVSVIKDLIDGLFFLAATTLCYILLQVFEGYFFHGYD